MTTTSTAVLPTALFDEMLELSIIIAPELSKQPLYLHAASDVPSAYTVPSSILAVAVNGPCPVLRQHLAEQGLWQGPGPHIVFADREQAREEHLEVLLHEVAHLLPAREIADKEPTEEDRTETVRLLREWSKSPQRFEGWHAKAPAWFPCHDRHFHLIVLHLWWRAALAGVVLPFDRLCAGFEMSLSPSFLYWRALGSDGVTKQNATFDEIIEAGPPEAFLNLWRADLRHWMAQQPDLTLPED